MLKDRRLWFLATVLLALALLLARPRGTVHVPPPAPAGTTAEPAALGPGAGATASAPEIGLAPRHPDVGFRDRGRLMEHFRKHGGEFGARTAEDYLRLAQTLRDRPKGAEVLQFVRNDAVTCRFDRESGAFIAYNSDGTIRTFFRPREGEAYFERQRNRGAGGP